MCGSGAAAAKAPLPASEHSASSAIGLRRPGRAGPRGVQRVGPIEGPRAAGWRGKVALLRWIRASSHLIEARLQKMSMEFRTALARAVAG